MRGPGDGHRANWDGAPNGTMANGAVGNVSSVDGPAIMVKYKDGEKKIIVTPSSHRALRSRHQIRHQAGAAFNIVAATKKPDGTFDAVRINSAATASRRNATPVRRHLFGIGAAN